MPAQQHRPPAACSVHLGPTLLATLSRDLKPHTRKVEGGLLHCLCPLVHQRYDGTVAGTKDIARMDHQTAGFGAQGYRCGSPFLEAQYCDPVPWWTTAQILEDSSRSNIKCRDFLKLAASTSILNCNLQQKPAMDHIRAFWLGQSSSSSGMDAQVIGHAWHTKVTKVMGTLPPQSFHMQSAFDGIPQPTELCGLFVLL